MNPMKKYPLLATALVGLFAGSAGAAIPPVSASFYVSGASAARAVTPSIAPTLCQAGTIARYEFSSKPKDHNLTVCTLKTSAQDSDVPAALSGLSVAIYGRAAGGSLFGVKPIVEPKFLQFIDPATCPNTDGVDGTVQQCTGLQGSDPTGGTPSGSGQVSILGISDQDPEFVGQVGKEVDTTGLVTPADPLTVGERAALNKYIAGTLPQVQPEAVFQLFWSIQANNSFPLTDISETTMRGIYSGVYQTVGQVMRAQGLSPSGAQDAQGLKVCLRTNTSGTAAGHANLWVGSNFCKTPGVVPQINESSDDGASNGYDVVMNSSSGNVESCLISSVNAIGINSLENAGLAGIKELSIDGVPATLVNGATGKYKWYNESTLQANQQTLDAALPTGGSNPAWNASVNASVEAASGAGATGDARRNGFATLFKAKARTSSAIAGAGLNGIVALPANGIPDTPFNPANPVGWTTKSALAGGSNCNAPFAIFP